MTLALPRPEVRVPDEPTFIQFPTTLEQIQRGKPRLQDRERAYPYDRDARTEHNLIARAIAHGRTAGGASSGRASTSAHIPSALLQDTYQRQQARLRDVARAVARGDFEAATAASALLAEADRAHRAAARLYAKDRRPRPDGAAHIPGGPFVITVDEGRLHFSVAFMWRDRPVPGTDTTESVLVVDDWEAIEREAGMPVGEDAWRELARWATLHDGRTWTGRPLLDDKNLIYRENQGFLKLRSHVARDFPRLPHALECLRRTLSPFWAADPHDPQRLVPVGVSDEAVVIEDLGFSCGPTDVPTVEADVELDITPRPGRTSAWRATILLDAEQTDELFYNKARNLRLKATGDVHAIEWWRELSGPRAAGGKNVWEIEIGGYLTNPVQKSQHSN